MRLQLICGGVFLAVCMSPLGASVLTFASAPPFGNNGPIDQNYGDRVTATTMGTFFYGSAGGFTPNVLLSYSPNTVPDYVYTWDTGFGDLVNVIAPYVSNANSSNYGKMQITLTADAGFRVTLTSFNLGGWNATDRIAQSLTIKDGSNNNLIAPLSNVLFQGVGHGTLSPNVTAQTIVISVDASNIINENGFNVGLDNIQFSQISNVPEPSTFGLMGVALAGLGWLRRKRS